MYLLTILNLFTYTDYKSLDFSVRVIHDVVFAIPNNASSEEIYVDISKAVKEAADNLVDCTRGKTHTQSLHN